MEALRGANGGELAGVAKAGSFTDSICQMQLLGDGTWTGIGNLQHPDASIVATFGTAGSRTGSSQIVAKCLTVIEGSGECGLNALRESVFGVDSEMQAVSSVSAMSGFQIAMRKVCGLPVSEGDGLAVAAASNDVAAVGRLLGPRDVNTVCFGGETLPLSLVRRPSECWLVDVAVGSGSVEMTKYLLEFHRAKPTRETLKQSISIGSFELIKRCESVCRSLRFEIGWN
jgi:hypothetical protein